MTDALEERFERDGYVLVRQVFDEKIIRDLRDLLQPQFDQKKTNYLPDAMLEYPQILRLLENPTLLSTLKNLLGGRFAIPPHCSVEFNRFGVFHTDTTGAEMSGHDFPRRQGFRMITVAIYLQDNNEYGGGISLVPGSHAKPDPYIDITRRKAEQRKVFNSSLLRQMMKRISRGRLFDWDKPFRTHSEARDVPSKVGDVVIWDMRMIHRATPPKVTGTSPQGKKLAVFFTCGVDNALTREAYMTYALSAPGNEFLQKYRGAGMSLPATPDYFIL